MIRARQFWLSSFLLLSMSGCVPPSGEPIPAPPAQVQMLPTSDITLVAPDGKTHVVRAEMARTPTQQQRGLMDRTSLPEGTGMLFVFQREIPLTFWMKHTLIPLDILFFDAKGMVVSWATMQPCEADPCFKYQSSAPAQYALELPEGTILEWKVTDGWQLQGVGDGLSENKK